MLNSVGVWRRYQIVSSHGTQGTYLQRLLVFTTARKKAPDGLIDLLFRRYLVDVRTLPGPGAAIGPRRARSVSGG